MNYKRIFTFGCSFTNYAWPTWADVLAVQTKIPTYNGAISGLGNVGILYRMTEYDLKFKFNDEDLILVMWTSWTREDRYIGGNWVNYGNVLNNLFYDRAFIKKYWDWDNDVIKNASSIILANRSFKIAQNYNALGIVEGTTLESPLLDFYKNSLPPAVRFEQDENWFNKKSTDGHPDILNHVDFYNKHVATKFNFPLVESNSIFHRWQREVISMLTLDKNRNLNEYFKRFRLSIK